MVSFIDEDDIEKILFQVVEPAVLTEYGAVGAGETPPSLRPRVRERAAMRR
jgi:hypothetical protein